jgi:hypothetical protein
MLDDQFPRRGKDGRVDPAIAWTSPHPWRFFDDVTSPCIRPVGEPTAPGRPILPFKDSAVRPSGVRRLHDSADSPGGCAQIDYTTGTRIPRGARIDMMTRAGETLRLEIESRLFAPVALGTG